MKTFGDKLWASLPVPAFLLDPGDVIAEVNIAAESFLNTSARSLKGAPVFDKLAIDAPIEESFRRVRTDQALLFINNVDVSSGDKPPVQCNIQIAPMIGMPASSSS
jgi:two-component system, NtrC family, nitrogen regulation sensor histidine kinase GlnL